MFIEHVRWRQVTPRRVKPAKMGTAGVGMVCNSKYGGEEAPGEKVIFDLRPLGCQEVHHADTWWKSIPGRGTHKCKGPEVRACG